MELHFQPDRGSFVPLYAQMAQWLREQIVGGAIPSGTKLPGENELAEDAAVSRMTVRSALEELVRGGYLEKLQGKGTFVRSGREAQSSGSIDVLLDVSYAYFSTYFIRSISDMLTRRGYRFVIHDTRDSQQEICTILDRVLADGSTGVILQPSHLDGPILPEFREALDRLAAHRIPCVLLDEAVDAAADRCITFDSFAGGRLAAEYLLSLGHRDCAMVCCGRYRENALRRDGFASLLSERGLPPLRTVDEADPDGGELLRLIREEGVTAVFNFNDEIALRTMQLLRRAGVRIPEDVSVVGFDDTILAQAADPPLTSVIHPKEQLGRIAAETLLDRIERKDAGSVQLPAPELHIRASCAGPRKRSE